MPAMVNFSIKLDDETIKRLDKLAKELVPGSVLSRGHVIRALLAQSLDARDREKAA